MREHVIRRCSENREASVIPEKHNDRPFQAPSRQISSQRGRFASLCLTKLVLAGVTEKVVSSLEKP